MRINESCVSSEDIKNLTGATQIIYLNSLGHYPWLLKGSKEIGDIVPYGNIYLGDDIIIKEIRIKDNKKLSEELTEKYKSKILIFSTITDMWN